MANPILYIANVDLQPRPAAFAPTGPAAERYDARMGIIVERESAGAEYWDGE